MTECTVCFEKVSKSRVIVCPFCDYVSCKACTERYCIESTEDMNCMNCHRYFDRTTQRKLFTKKFIEKDYKKRREDLLLQREIALLPATQPAVYLEKRRRTIRSKICDLEDKQIQLRVQMRRITQEIYNLNNSIYNHGDIDDDLKDIKSASTFVMKCSHENCKGYLSRAYKCGTCLNYTCPECHEPKQGRNDPNHVCDENKKKNVNAIMRECKPCISCGTYIYKTDGCSQMFCTQCNILFDWNTGKNISHSSGHNPHFISWLRSNGRNTRDIGDILCGGLPDIRTIIESTKLHPDTPYIRKVSLVIRVLLHIHHEERPRHPIIWNNDAESESMRVSWSLGDFSDDEFKHKRQRLEKKNLLNKEIGLVLEMIVNSATDILQRLVAEPSPENITSLFTELDNIRIIANEKFSSISKDFSNKVPCILDTWQYVGKG